MIVYGLRITGETEMRYIGLTMYAADVRLRGHLAVAKQMPVRTNFACWLMENQQGIEAIELQCAVGSVAGRAAERAVISLCRAMGHRLFNIHGVPREERIPMRPSTPAQAVA